jgi:acyl dehydratase
MYIDEIKIGHSASMEREVTQEVINRFADVSGDFNPVHVDPEYAAASQFNRDFPLGINQGE